MFSKQTSKLKTKSYKHRKKWLMSKVHDLKKQYDDILTAFQQKLDSIVNPAFDKATRILSTPDEEEFLKEVYDAGIGLEKCSNDLFEITLFCLGENFFSEDESELSECDTSPKNLGVSSDFLHSTCVTNGFQQSSSTCISTFATNSTLKCSTGISSTPCKDTPPPKNPDALSKVKQEISSNNDIDLLLLHNITIGEKKAVLVSDVASPSHFSVQPEESKDQLVGLQRELNSLYSQEWTDRLKFGDRLEVGTICVALFTIDHCWYRARILKEQPDNKYEVIYIDYGNHNIVKKDDLRIIDPGFGNIPQLSIQCSLFGVEPASTKGEPFEKWSLPATEWFDSQVFGKWFIAQFARNANSPSYSVHLHIEKETANGQTTSWSVADNLVCMGYAAFTSNLSIAHVESETDRKQHKELSLVAHTPSAQRSLLRPLPPVTRGEVHVIPGGFESEIKATNSRKNVQKSSPSRFKYIKSNDAELAEAVSYQEPNSRRSLSALTSSKPCDLTRKCLSLSAEQTRK